MTTKYGGYTAEELRVGILNGMYFTGEVVRDLLAALTQQPAHASEAEKPPSGHHPEYVKGFNEGKRVFQNAFDLGIQEGLQRASEAGEAVATLHDDGYWTWKRGKEILESRQAGWRMDVYAAPAQQAVTLTDAAIDCALCAWFDDPAWTDWNGITKNREDMRRAIDAALQSHSHSEGDQRG